MPDTEDRLGPKGNNPPLEDRIIIEFDEALNEHEGLIARIDAIEERAGKAGPCLDEDTAGRYGDFLKMASAAQKVIEAEREVLNRPLLTAQRALKARADRYASRLEDAMFKVRTPLNAFIAEQERQRREAERKRQEEAARVERERQAAIAEAERVARVAAEQERRRLQAIADAAAEAERKRLQDLADAKAEKERAARQAEEDARAAAIGAEAHKVEVTVEEIVVEAETIVVEAEPVIIAEPEPEFVTKAAPKGPIRGDMGTSVSAVSTWDVEVVNVRQVPDMFLKHPTVIEALEKVIRPNVRGKAGMRDIKGCRIFEKLGSAVR